MADYNLVNPPIMESPDQVAALLLKQGFTPEQAAQLTAFSIGNEDPSGNASVVNDTPATGDYSVGLWQINYYGNLMGPRSQEFGSPQSLAGNPDAQAAAAKALFTQSGYQPWQADIGKQDVANALPRAVQAVNDVQSGHITVADVATSTASYGYTGAGSGATTGYQPAATAFGKVLQEIDGFYNPKISALPSWTNLLDFGTTSVANTVLSATLTAVDRIVGVLFGVGLVYMGVRMFSDRSGSGVVSSGVSAAKFAIGTRARLQVAEMGAQSRQAVTAQRTAAQQQKSATDAAKLAQRARETAARQAAQEASLKQRQSAQRSRARQNTARVKAQQEATRVRAQAEARRSAEDANAGRRRRDRPAERGVA